MVDALFLLIVALIELSSSVQFLLWVVGVGMAAFCVGLTVAGLLARRWSPRRVQLGFLAVAAGLMLWSGLFSVPPPARDARAILDDPALTSFQKASEIEYDHGAFGGMPGRVARHWSPAAAGAGLLFGSLPVTFLVQRARRRRAAKAG